jgi:hypothetical protein
MAGLVAPLERKNGWSLAERAGEAHPVGMQRLLGEADWDADGVRDDVRDFVIESIGDKDAVLIGDDTGFLKKGVRSAGAQRQYSGTAGRTENCQIGTFLAYASRRGRVLIDRESYLPKSWTDDRERCRAVGVPDDVPFATKIEHFQAKLQRALDAKAPFAWVTADEAYGQVKRCGTGWSSARSRTCWRPRSTTPSSPPVAPRPGSTPWWPACRGRHGSACRQGPAPTGTGSTTGPGCRSGSGGRTASATVRGRREGEVSDVHERRAAVPASPLPRPQTHKAYPRAVPNSLTG